MPRPGIDQEQLITSIATVFAERGYEGATMAELSRATGLQKASLYYHYPGGKDEMLGAVVRASVNRLDTMVFSHLRTTNPPRERIARLLDGFDTYCDRGRANCVLSVVAHGTSAAAFKPGIAAQFGAWLKILAKTLEDSGMSAKRANRVARETLSTLYGSLIASRLLDDLKVYAQATKRLRKQLASR